MSNQKTYNVRSGAEEDNLTADLLQIQSLLQRVMQRQNIMMGHENYICKACRQAEIVTTINLLTKPSHVVCENSTAALNQ